MTNKFLVLTAFLIGSFSLGYSQSQVIQDTTYLEKKGGKYTEVTKVTYENGEVETKAKPLGDSLQVVNYYLGKYERLSTEYVTNVKNALLTLNTSYNQVGKDNTSLQLGGFPPLIFLITDYNIQKYEGNWNFRNEKFEMKPCKISEKDGTLVINLEGKTYKTIVFSDNHIRMLDYPTQGNMIDLFELYTNVFIDWTQTFIIFK